MSSQAVQLVRLGYVGLGKLEFGTSVFLLSSKLCNTDQSDFSSYQICSKEVEL